MNTKTESGTRAPRKLQKPVREEQELKREELVTYEAEMSLVVPTAPPVTVAITFFPGQ